MDHLSSVHCSHDIRNLQNQQFEEVCDFYIKQLPNETGCNKFGMLRHIFSLLIDLQTPGQHLIIKTKYRFNVAISLLKTAARNLDIPCSSLNLTYANAALSQSKKQKILQKCLMQSMVHSKHSLLVIAVQNLHDYTEHQGAVILSILEEVNNIICGSRTNLFITQKLLIDIVNDLRTDPSYQPYSHE